ncbi:MAG TPA: hypothetical protein VFW19_10840 [Allosphingosinicella sp.]|nr:hypothetical protein [Allosphingosinicella sp.]
MDIGVVIGGGFRIIRDKPLAVLAWAIVFLLMLFPTLYLMRPMMEAQAQMQAQVAANDPQAQLAAMGVMMGRLLLLFLMSLVVYVILFAAAQRAVLKPEQRGFFYIRLGMDELRLLALSIIFLVAYYVATLVLTVVLSILMAIVIGATGSAGAAAILSVAMIVALIAFTAFYYIRFGLAFPLTMLREKIVIGEAWRISRGRFWALFAASLVVVTIIAILWIAVTSVTSGAYFADVARNAGDPAAVQRLERAQVARELGFSVTSVVMWVGAALAGALTVTLWGGSAATAVKQLTFNPRDIAETFA